MYTERMHKFQNPSVIFVHRKTRLENKIVNLISRAKNMKLSIHQMLKCVLPRQWKQTNLQQQYRVLLSSR